MLLKQVQQEEHPNCILCGQHNEQGLKLNFHLTEDGSVEALFRCSKVLEGYKNFLHGGIISALLDGAMTNCLFAHGIKALTAKLQVRFFAPVDSEDVVRLRAMIQRSRSRFYILKSELYQKGVLKALGSATFARFGQSEPTAHEVQGIHGKRLTDK